MAASLPASFPPLNDAQRAAVTATLDPQLVIAGPGTGKTRVLVCRAAYLHHTDPERFAPSKLALITFTNRAGRQLKERLADDLMQPEDVQHVHAGTIHHFCYTVLRSHGARVEVPDDFVVADQAVLDAYWQRWFEDNKSWCYDHDLRSWRAVQTHVSQFKLNQQSLRGRRLVQAHTAYEAMLNERHALDFDDVLTNARTVVHRYPDVAQSVAERFPALLVDEFQDTDPVQYALLKRLATAGAHLFCVADEDQSIYRFRGARPENVRQYIDDFGCSVANGTQHVLSTNYRSNRSIYAAAEAVLSPDDRLKTRGAIRTQDPTEAPIHVLACATEAQEIDLARRVVQRWRDQGAEPKALAVLAPWNSIVKDLERTFLEAGIPCEASSTDALLERPLLRKLRALLRVAQAQLAGNDSFVHAAGLPDLLQRLLPPDAWARLEQFHRSTESMHLWGTFQALLNQPSAMERAGLTAERGALEHAYALIVNLMQEAAQPGQTVEAFVESALQQLGDPLQLLKPEVDVLRDPATLPGQHPAARALQSWQRSRDTRRLLIHHPTTQITRLWRQLVWRALTDAPPLPVPDVATALFADPAAPEGPLTADDVVLTPSLGDFVQWIEGQPNGLNSAPTIIVLRPAPDVPDERLRLLGLQPERIHAVGTPEAGATPSVRLFKLLQQTTAGDARAPLFDDYVMVDLETTSADPARCRVAEIGAIRVTDGAVVDRFERLVALPDDLTADEAATLRSVCGLDPATDFEAAVPLRDAWAAFCAFADEAPLVAHNGQRFDFRVLRRLRDRFADAVDARWTVTYDMLPAAAELFPSLASYAMEHLRTTLLDEARPTAHRALADCEDQQAVLAALQTERARQQRLMAHEPLLPLVLAALFYEAPPPDRLDDDAAALLRVGYLWTARDASPVRDDLRTLLARDLLHAVRQRPFFRAIEDALFSAAAVRGERASSMDPPGLTQRIASLIRPHAHLPLADAIDDLLTYWALWGPDDTSLGENVVTISTYHSAKGLEFERVLCMGVHESAFPPWHADTEQARRESRRVLYVGMTRAMQHLVLSYNTEARQGHRRRSPFLNDVPPPLLHETDMSDRM
ncbi:UvrD-helicase domain-containing protein [Salisaeta longa]|uniref:UvrD-helicase domain-containing protein n=1 Tax=Salisaeta longa TaxID=503170 RepID=UPI0003B57F5E|nr:UvrD-helicase domain-containing protein [Salisaeta longa]